MPINLLITGIVILLFIILVLIINIKKFPKIQWIDPKNQQKKQKNKKKTQKNPKNSVKKDNITDLDVLENLMEVSKIKESSLNSEKNYIDKIRIKVITDDKNSSLYPVVENDKLVLKKINKNEVSRNNPGPIGLFPSDEPEYYILATKNLRYLRLDENNNIIISDVFKDHDSLKWRILIYSREIVIINKQGYFLSVNANSQNKQLHAKNRKPFRWSSD